tara:strand:- start:3675 stop:5288 length:1614 start_codon:yes stop_codon:yes gene_type:complete
MPNYLKQYTQFSQGITDDLAQSRQSTLKSLSDYGRVQAQRNQAEAKRQAEVRKQIVDDQAKFDGNDMWSWQANVEQKHIEETGRLFAENKIDALTYTTMINGIYTDIEKMKTNYRAEVGNPETAKETDSTYYGYLGAIDAWVERGENVYEDNRVIIKGLDQGDEGVASAQRDLNRTFRTRNLGKSRNEQVVDGFYDENYQWTYSVGDPTNLASMKNIAAKDFLANNEGPNAFLREMTMVDPQVMADYASSKEAEQFVGDGGAEEVRQYYNVQFGRDKHFRRDVFDQFGPGIFGDTPDIKTLRDIFVGMEGSGMGFNGGLTSMDFDPNIPNAKMFEKVWELGQSNMIQEYEARHKNKDVVPRSEMLNDNKIIPIPFEGNKAYQDVVLAETGGPQQNYGGKGAFNQNFLTRDDFKDIGPMTGLGKAIQMGELRDELVGASLVFSERGNLDNKLVGQFVKYGTRMVPDPSIPEETRRLLVEQGQGAVTMIEEKVPMPYYAILDNDQAEAFYRAIGNSINAAPGDAEKEGARYIYNKYTNR